MNIEQIFFRIYILISHLYSSEFLVKIPVFPSEAVPGFGPRGRDGARAFCGDASLGPLEAAAVEVDGAEVAAVRGRTRLVPRGPGLGQVPEGAAAAVLGVVRDVLRAGPLGCRAKIFRYSLKNIWHSKDISRRIKFGTISEPRRTIIREGSE